ncbi:MAG: 3-ketoacyl-ACP reductase [Planctomycetales bacterium]|nr:3-ketoacyl-ACP reductase [Planctomycetales bacterium]
MPNSQFPVAIVTGASRGIGRAIAERLASADHRVLVNYCHRRDAADEVVAAITLATGDPHRARVAQADVGSAPDRHRLVEEAVNWAGRVDILVNNAGITSPGRLDVLDATEENWDLVLGTNLKGPFFLTQLVAKQMLTQTPLSSGTEADRLADNVAFDQRRGTIVNISSVSAYAVSTNRPDYCVAKAGLEMATWLFATRLADEGVLVYEISPGVIASDMTAPVREKYDALIADGLTPIRRWGQPDDVAQAVTSLATGAFPFCTGQRIHVDGGFHMRRL